MTFLTIPSGPLRVAAIGAHPDDIEIGCGGTLLTLAARPETEVRSLVLTGTPERQAEARDAAELFGATAPPRFGGLADARLPSAWAAVKDALHAFRDEFPQPDIVLAPRPDDAHQDHALLGSLVTTVWRGPLVLHYEIPKWDGDLGRPNMYVPLSVDTAQRKVELLHRAFPSQHSRDWWDDEFFLSLLRLRGAETLTRYAEAFTASKAVLHVW
ncbi:PIG-L deacetylase family protein [Microbacterium ulmi]|uniref:PIG-L family deacetylase n=1 Tax=Microbacterium ulmi TaxID=179095 RepID=A0A7Y2Q0H1_9MICO|nr:PIG-L family deacetylase [Microbacterium ulmi]NII69744.1 LmbE family N-acetylglucosaminyl deacetylase [Microbacterium ulmi]NNH03282.1 PIG-L family deacetylase [Microbacterium ulmi]